MFQPYLAQGARHLNLLYKNIYVMSSHSCVGDEQYDANNTVCFSPSCGQNQGTYGGCSARYIPLLLVSLTRSAMQSVQSCPRARTVSSSATYFMNP